MHTNVEQIFSFIDTESTFIEEQQSGTYLEGVVYARLVLSSIKKTFTR